MTEVDVVREDSLVIEPPTSRQIREKLQHYLEADLLGPAGGEDEELSRRERLPTDRYILGLLAPRGTQLPAGEDDDFGVAAGEDEDTNDAPSANQDAPKWAIPSSIGITLSVDCAVASIAVTASWGKYLRITSDTQVTDKGSPARVWKREPHGGTVDISLRPFPEVNDASSATQEMLGIPDPSQSDVLLTGRIRKHHDGSCWIVSLFLDNQQSQIERNKSEQWLFQAEFSVTAPDGAPIFLSRRIDGASASPEDREIEMLYRSKHEFAVGHGVAVAWDPDPSRPDRARRVGTATIPVFELPRTDATAMKSVTLDMATLASAKDGDFGRLLGDLPARYRAWIQTRRNEIPNRPDLLPYQLDAERALKECDRAADRITAGIAVLDANPQAAEAFRFANEAMHQQRVHTLWAQERRKAEVPEDVVNFDSVDVPKNRSWRPFQLAFILSNLPGLSDLAHPNRSTGAEAEADLLWFPTGGGKTEAYLGLTVYVLAMRRLQATVDGHDGGYGVGVVMRYTLRLLTLQQFQRATALMCACEVLRRKDPVIWGDEPFRIGLWVGKSMTPNWTKDAEEALRNDKSGGFKGGLGNPHQLTSCPWCGNPIDRKRDVKVYAAPRDIGRTIIYCGDPMGNCPFSLRQSLREGIPAVVVDEEIYHHPPSLLIATVDKFAQMPWKGAVQNLFGRFTERCSRHGFYGADLDDSKSHPRSIDFPPVRAEKVNPARPPDLIIQDELHLISGPLGTMVGLYETAIDELMTWEVNGKRVRPKVIASTATVRRATDQIHSVFMRKANIFPPNGLDATSNFFAAQQEPDDEHPGRLYLGIAARGSRLKAALIRVYTALLSASQKLHEEYGELADPYMTLVGYFGALRELGGMRRLVDDDITQRLRFMEERGLARRDKPIVEELTSRRNSEEIPRILDRLETPASQRGVKGKQYPIDVLLATNMISVGVDVQRLGLMVVSGQPKNTAEYIQATSRVGRREPGLVVTIYNWTRPRDLSHYERFEQYHATLYRQVEALTVTPFAPRAVDRGLAGLLVSMTRLHGESLAFNADARKVFQDRSLPDTMMERIVARASAVTRDNATADRVRKELHQRAEEWVKRADPMNMSQLVYDKPHKDKTGDERILLSRPEEQPPGAWDLFATLSSLRDVEAPVGLVLRDYGMDDHVRPVTSIIQTQDAPAEEDL